MKTIEIQVFTFDELSDKAKQKAITHQRYAEIDHSFIYTEAKYTVDAFCELFNIKTSNRSWLEYGHSTHETEDMSNERLMAYIWNNFGSRLFKGKYYSLWSKKDISFKHHTSGHPVLKKRHSKVMFENCCVLTGVCYDDAMLHPIYEFLSGKNYQNYSFDSLMDFCFQSLKKVIDNEIEYRNSDEAIEELFSDNDFQFTADGNRFI